MEEIKETAGFTPKSQTVDGTTYKAQRNSFILECNRQSQIYLYLYYTKISRQNFIAVHLTQKLLISFTLFLNWWTNLVWHSSENWSGISWFTVLVRTQNCLWTQLDRHIRNQSCLPNLSPCTLGKPAPCLFEKNFRQAKKRNVKMWRITTLVTRPLLFSFYRCQPVTQRPRIHNTAQHVKKHCTKALKLT